MKNIRFYNSSLVYALAVTLSHGMLFTAPDCMAELELSDEPLDIVTRPAPSNIMFVFDDSGSMDWDVLMEGENEGRFANGRCFIYDTGDNATSNFNKLIGNEHKAMWKSRCIDYNKVHYDPSVTYKPWPKPEGRPSNPNQSWALLPNANIKNVKSHPYKSNSKTYDLSSEYVKIDNDDSIPRAHYFVESDSGIILVALDYKNEAIKYYTVTKTTGNGVAQKVTKISSLTNPPSNVVTGRTFEKEAQNFANWFSFYRRRSFTATAALAQAITTVNNSYIGILSMHPGEKMENEEVVSRGIRQPLIPVDLNKDEGFVEPPNDGTDTLLENLYKLHIKGTNNTLLLTALQNVGEYYDQNGDEDSGGFSDTPSPWSSKEEGGECQQSFAIAMTDGYYNDSVKLSPEGNVDGEEQKPYKDSYSNTLADIAMYYYNKDLVVDKKDGDEDIEESLQHMKTYGVSFGVDGKILLKDHEGDDISYDLKTCTEKDITSGKCNYPGWCDEGDKLKSECINWNEGWPDPSKGKKEKVDDLFHASVNGGGKYLSANDPQKLAEALTSIFADIEAEKGSAASVSVNGDELYSEASSGKVLMYQTQYQYLEESSDWLGEVVAYKVKSDGSVDTKSCNDYDAENTSNNSEWCAWKASVKLDKNSARAVATYHDTNGVEFEHDKLKKVLSNKELKEFFGRNGAEQIKMVDYIKGVKRYEISNGGTYRDRASLLGDIVNSGAHYHEDYLYVGANDGMMHALDAKTGDEKFAYIPSMVLSNLKDLAAPDYGDKHKFFVDGTPVVTKMGDLSYLVGGLGKGGKGYYSIDVTNVGDENKGIKNAEDVAGRVLWEYPRTDTPVADKIDDLGYTFSKAHTVKSYADIKTDGVINDGDLAGYVTFFGNGYGSKNGDAALYFLNPADGTLVKKIEVGGTTGQNGMGTPVAVDINNDNKMDYIYAGDLEGNMWKFDVQSPNPDNWKVAYFEGATPMPLVTTADGQAITSTPDITRHPSGIGYMVVFGTGRFLGASDWEDSTTQSFYGIWDYGTDENNEAYLGKVKDREDLEGADLEGAGHDLDVSLLEQTVDFYDFYSFPIKDDSGTIIGTNKEKVRILTDHNPDWSLNEGEESPNVHAGWYFNLPLTGERSTVDVIIRDGKAIMVSFYPDDDRCAGGAQSLVHELDVYTGGRLTKPTFDANGDGIIDERDMVELRDEKGNIIWVAAPSAILKDGRLQAPAIIGLGDGSEVEVKHFSSSTGEIETVTETKEKLGVYYWREF